MAQVHQHTITLSMDKEELQKAMTALLEQLSFNPFEPENHTRAEQISFNMGLGVIFECMRSTFK